MLLKTLGEYIASSKIKALVYGRSKVGKTFGAGTFPRPCFMDFDSGIATLTGADFIKKHGVKKDVIYEQFHERGLTARGVPQTANAFDDGCRFFDKTAGSLRVTDQSEPCDCPYIHSHLH